MTIEKAQKAAKLLERKGELEKFFENIMNVKSIEKTVVHFDCVAKDGTVYPCFCELSAEVFLPCLKEELDGINRAIKNL